MMTFITIWAFLHDLISDEYGCRILFAAVHQLKLEARPQWMLRVFLHEG